MSAFLYFGICLSLTMLPWQSNLVILSAALPLHLILIHGLRYRRFHANSCQSPPGLNNLALSEAFSVHNDLIQLEFPTIFSLATTFALFKAYGIPSISALLVKTNQLNGPPLVSSKRYVDTGALLLEAVLNEPGSKRSVEAIARINWLHDRHRSRGAISDADMLFTLSLFALEPKRWVKKYEWRELSARELCAVGTLWKYLGVALKVPFEDLPNSDIGWSNGLDWMRDLETWSRKYEEKHMVPAESNHTLAEATFRILLFKVPTSLHELGRNLFVTLMEEKLRKAMLQVLIDEPSPLYYKTVPTLVALRKFFLRHLSLPRHRRVSRLPEPSPSNDGRMHLSRARVYPWYIPPTFKHRWGPSALLKRLKGEVLPGNDKTFMPEGFLTGDLGPKWLMGKGQDDMKIDAERLEELATRGGCPLTEMQYE